MPRFYFDVHNDKPILNDQDGHKAPDLETARTEAIEVLAQVARDAIPKAGDRQSFVVLVTDEDGKSVYSATLSFVGTWLVR